MSERDVELDSLLVNMDRIRFYLGWADRQIIDDAIARLRAPVDPPERVSEQGDTTWHHYPTKPVEHCFGGLDLTGRVSEKSPTSKELAITSQLRDGVSEASALQEMIEDMEQESPPGDAYVPSATVQEWVARLRALEDTKGGA